MSSFEKTLRKKYSPETIQAVKKYNLIDDVLFTKAAEDKKFCEEILRTILDDQELIVVRSTPQSKLQNLKGRSVVFDALCKLKGGAMVDIEVQKANNDDHLKRVRYNSAVLTANITSPGTKFRRVPNVIIIFISKFDIFKDGYALYHVDKIVRESSRKIEDGLDEIYVNSAVKDGSKVSELMELFVDLKAYNKDEFPVVSETKKIYKETEEGVQTMCEITEKLYKKGRKLGFAEGEASGIAKGETKGFLKSIKSMINKLRVSPNEAMDILEIPSNERSIYFEKLKEVK